MSYTEIEYTIIINIVREESHCGVYETSFLGSDIVSTTSPGRHHRFGLLIIFIVSPSSVPMFVYTDKREDYYICTRVQVASAFDKQNKIARL